MIQTETETIQIEYGPSKGTYNVHPMAQIFPLLQGSPYEELKTSIQTAGQQEQIVFDGAVLLDGRNRMTALNELGIEPWIVQFADLNTGLNPGVWTATKNLHRRHLTDDQKLALTARYEAWCKDECDRLAAVSTPPELAEPIDGSGVPGGERLKTEEPIESPVAFPQKPAEIPPPAKRGRPSGRRTEAKNLAAETKQSRYRAEQILKIRDNSPDIAVAVEQGKTSLKQAMAQLRGVSETVKGNSMVELQTTTDETKIKGAAQKVIKHARREALKLPKAEQPFFWAELVMCAQGICNG
jgi:hypothetical protein